MPVAGNNLEVFHLYTKNGRLVNLGKHRYPSHLVEDRVDVAVAELMRGKPVFLYAYSDNLTQVKTELAKQGITV